MRKALLFVLLATVGVSAQAPTFAQATAGKPKSCSF